MDVAGFKSFCEKTHLTFSGAGLTCIVGPNGCGKSNIVDAISWVLGEQSHKSLRAERMSDCIFNGTVKRPPMGMAEVTLTLVDPELSEAARKVLGMREPHPAEEQGASEAENGMSGATSEQSTVSEAETGFPHAEQAHPARKKRPAQAAVPNCPGEIVIGRRLYRSGQSEYLINGRPARLRDIQELFMGIGLGPDSYAIIEQGRIGQVLSSKPSDRRAIIEEAAGITKYKTKKRLAEAKLESSKANLARVNDIYVEVEKQLASLKRQASKARRYAETREQMRHLLRQIFAGKTRALQAEAERIAGLLSEIGGQEQQEAAALAQMEMEQARLDRRIEERDAELRQNHNLIGMAALESDRCENRIVFNKQRAEQLRQRGQQISAEAGQLAAQASTIDSQIAGQARQVLELRSETDRIASRLSALEGRSAEFAREAEQAQIQSAGLRGLVLECRQFLAQLQEAERQIGAALAHSQGALGRLEESERRLEEEAAQQQERARRSEQLWQEANGRAKGLNESAQALQERMASIGRQRQQAATQMERLREALAGLKARQQTIERILHDHSYSAEAVQKLFAAHGSARAASFRAVGTLADYAEVDPQYEPAVEQFLREELEYVIVETFDHARMGISLLREELGGRATFFVDSLRNLSVPAEPPEPAAPFEGQQCVIARLDRMLEFRDPLGAAAKRFLPRLRSAFLVKDAASAETLAAANPSFSFLTADGTCYQGRAVTGGRPAEAGPLAIKRELRMLEAEIREREAERGAAQARAAELETELARAKAGWEEISAQEIEAGKMLVAATMERDAAQGEAARLAAALRECREQIAALRASAASAQQRAGQILREREATQQKQQAAEAELAAIEKREAQMRQAAGSLQEELASVRAEKATFEERLANAAALEARLQQQRGELAARVEALFAQQRETQSEIGAIESQTAELGRQALALRAERERLESRQSEMETDLEECRRRAAAVDDALRLGRQKLAERREERGRLEVEKARNDAEREHLRAACRDELGAWPEELLAAASEAFSPEQLAAADEQYRELKSRLESMGPINMMALEEYNQCEERFGFLGREREDLLKSIQDTQQAISELDQISRQKFEEAFAAINSHFAAAFQTLFGGGTGQMRLSEPDTSGDPGIDIVAQPPGKRLQNVLLLSGGEKALTALALLIAVFRYQPSPFCILDEVDAPLDETNVGRFAQMISEMSADAQFIVVTHNRRTMEMASALYGVTMQEPGVSKLVSVSWEQARAAAGSAA